MAEVTCTGTWVGWREREAPDGGPGYEVARCSDPACRDFWVILADRRRTGTGATEEDALRAALLSA